MPLIVMPELDSLQELPYFYDGLELQHVGTIGFMVPSGMGSAVAFNIAVKNNKSIKQSHL